MLPDRGHAEQFRRMTVLSAAGRGLRFSSKVLVAGALMLVAGLLQVPALIWYVTVATPACSATAADGSRLAAQIGIGALGAATLALSVVLAVRFLRLRWGWLAWWPVSIAAIAAPAAALYMLPTLSPGVGGLFCH